MTTSRSHERARRVSGFTIGRKAFAKISAVEGLQLTAAMEADFREFDRKGLSATERRAVLSRKYAPTR